MQINSSAFQHGSPIPAQYTCDDRNASPPLAWTDIPAGAKTIALIVDDPDAPGGTWVHWVLFDLPATTAGLPEDLPRSQYLPGGAKQGLNDFGRLGYGGPCPPPGKAHRYFFKLYALNSELELKPGATKESLEQAMKGRLLAQSELMGTYQRRR